MVTSYGGRGGIGRDRFEGGAILSGCQSGVLFSNRRRSSNEQ